MSGIGSGGRTVDAAGPRGRGWRLALAAVVAVIGAGVVLLVVVRRDDGEVTPEATVVDELLAAVPTSALDRTATIRWVDLGRARAEGTLPQPATPMWTGVNDPDTFWDELAVDLAEIDGWVTHGVAPRDVLVVVGGVDAVAIDDAVRTNSGAHRLEVGIYRGVTTYSWGEDFHLDVDRRDEFAGFRALRVAVIDDTLILASGTAELHAAIDLRIDGGPSVLTEPPIRRLVARGGDHRPASSGYLIVRPELPYLAQSWVPGPTGVPSLALVVERGTDPRHVADDIEAALDAGMRRGREADPDAALAETEVTVDVEQDLILVHVELPDGVDIQQDGRLEEYWTSVAPIVAEAVFPHTGGAISTTSGG